MSKVLTDRTAARLMRLLNSRETGSAKATPSGEQQWAFVRCDSATAVGGNAVLDECYPATILKPVTRSTLPPAEHPRGALLTLLGEDGNPAAPTAGRVYVALVGSEVPSDGSGSLDGRPRAFGVGAEVSAADLALAARNVVVRAATILPLPAWTYSNGASGVGATLTGTGNGALASTDGVTLLAGDELLVMSEAAVSAAIHGVYTLTQRGDGSSPFILTRHTDADTAGKLLGLTVKVMEGGTWRDTEWQSAADETITVGTTVLYFELIGRRGHPAELTSTWDVTYGYDWKRLSQDDVALADASPSVTGRYARTARGNTGLAIGTKGWLEPAHAPGDRGWIFIPDSLTGATGSLGGATGLPLTTGVTGVLPSANGGTGVNNGFYQQTLGGNVSTGGALTTAGGVTVAGAYSLTATLTATTSVTLPTSGTLLSTTSTGTALPTWTLLGTVTHADLTGVGSNEDIPAVVTLAAKTSHHAFFIRTVVAGDDVFVQMYLMYNGIQIGAVGDGITVNDTTAQDVIGSPQMRSWTSGTDVGISFTTNGATGDLTTGEWELWGLIATVP